MCPCVSTMQLRVECPRPRLGVHKPRLGVNKQWLGVPTPMLGAPETWVGLPSEPSQWGFKVEGFKTRPVWGSPVGAQNCGMPVCGTSKPMVTHSLKSGGRGLYIHIFYIYIHVYTGEPEHIGLLLYEPTAWHQIWPSLARGQHK